MVTVEDGMYIVRVQIGDVAHPNSIHGLSMKDLSVIARELQGPEYVENDGFEPRTQGINHPQWMVYRQP